MRVREASRFLHIATVALLLAAAVVLLFPVAAVFKRLVEDGHPVRPLVAIGAFVAVVRFGVAFAWSSGDLDP